MPQSERGQVANTNGWFMHVQRYLPISAVHCIFTAAVIHLLDIVHTEGRTRAKAKQRFDVCIRSMEEMRITWGWSGRCLRSLQSLVKEWNVDLTACSEEPVNPAPPVATATDPKGPSPLSEHSSDGLLGGRNSIVASDKYRLQENIWGTESLPWGPVAGAGALQEEWAAEVPGSEQFSASFVNQWWQDATI